MRNKRDSYNVEGGTKGLKEVENGRNWV